jgi:hypothetical protein
MKFCKLLLLTLLISKFDAFSQQTDTELFRSKPKNERYDAGAPIISPLLFPSYTPDMGFFITGGGLLSFKTKRNNDYLSHSMLPILAGFNSNKDFYINTNFTSYWVDDRLLFFINGFYQKRDDNYWGIGMENGKTVPKSDSTTLYKNESYKFTPALSFKIIQHLFVGLKADFNKTTATDLPDLMKEDQTILKYGPIVKNTGLGLLLCYDSRDVPTNPYKGIFVNIEELFYSKSLSGDYNYKIFGFDYRQYLPIIRRGSLIALQLNSQIGFGDIPWSENQKLGTPNDLRGYYWGQYRDKSSLIFQLEYRHTFSFNDSEKLSRHGFVFWISGGTVFPDLNHINDLVFSTGAGYRFEIQPRQNIRIDLGFGTENVGLYIGYNETF